MTMFSLQSYTLLLALIVVVLAVASPIFRYHRDPLKLKKFPAPNILAAATPLWLIQATWSQRRSRILHEEFKRLGDVIRVSPDNIIFNDPAAIKDIYGVLATSRGVGKDAIYDRMAGDAHDLVQLRDRAEHSSRRKALANAFAAKTVTNMEPVIRQSFHRLVNNIDRLIDVSLSSDESIVNLRLW